MRIIRICFFLLLLFGNVDGLKESFFFKFIGFTRKNYVNVAMLEKL